MTRETKFALIIGFTLILVVGVLITDHFSGANRAAIADVSGLDQSRSSSMPIEPLVAVNDLTGLPEQAPSYPRETSPPVELHQRLGGGPGQGSTGPDLTGQGGRGNTPWSDSGAPAPRGQDPLWNDPRFTPVDSEHGRPLPGGDVQPSPESPVVTPPAPGAAQPAQQPPAVVPAADAPITHVVTAKDSLYDIAKKYYGKGSLWPKLAAANPGKVGKEGTIREGAKLSIPAVLDGIARRGSAPVQPGTAPTTPPAAPPAEPGSPRKYTVQKGDTLGIIAKRELGSAKRIEDILELNPDIDDEDTIFVGMVITLPPKK